MRKGNFVRKQAFTLIELLVVMAITAVLLTIIVVPVFQSFSFVRLAQSFSDAQLSARQIMNKVSGEISNAVAVRDNSGTKGEIAIVVPSGPGSVNPFVTILLPSAKIDIIKASEGEPDGSGTFIDPSTGKVDPTLITSKGQVSLPLGPGTTIVRYFIGLRDPFNPYNNPYNTLLGARGTGRDNLYVLYRAEVPINSTFFAKDPVTNQFILDDPFFFVHDVNFPSRDPIIKAWQSRVVIQTEVSRYDMIEPAYNKYSQQTQYVLDAAGDQVPQLIPLLQFRPTRVSNEPATAMNVNRLGDESDTALTNAPDVFRTKLGGWSDAVVHLFPTPLNGGNLAFNPVIGLNTTRSDGTTGFSVYSTTDGTTPGTEMFDVNTYSGSIGSKNPYIFTAGVTAANTRSGFLGNLATLNSIFEPFYYDPQEGKVYGSFSINEVGLNPLPPTPSDPLATRPNLPLGNIGSTQIYSNSTSTAPIAGPNALVNDSFNVAYNTYPTLRPYLHRFINLAVTANEDGTFGPLFPVKYANLGGTPQVVAKGNAVGFARASIVPGSEVVYGPDQMPGAGYGQKIRYTRIAEGNPGPDQYKINYSDLALPDFVTLLGTIATGLDTTTYDPTNPVSGLIQPQYMAGYVELNSDPNQALPNLVPIQVSYRFQFTGARDTMAVDYDSRQEISLLVTIRNYPQQNTTPNPQVVTLRSTATIRNFIR